MSLAYTSSALICNECGGTYETNYYNNDFLNALKECPDCGGEMIYHSISDRYETDGDYWCRDLGGYYRTENCDPDSCGVVNPLTCPKINENW